MKLPSIHVQLDHYYHLSFVPDEIEMADAHSKKLIVDQSHVIDIDENIDSSCCATNDSLPGIYF